MIFQPENRPSEQFAILTFDIRCYSPSQNSYTFSIELEKTIPIVEKLLYSMNPGDAIEACSFLGAAYQFQIPGALPGVRKALFQIFCRDQSVRDNLAAVYKEIYLNHGGNQASSRAKALQSVKSLIQLLDGMLPGQSSALAKLMVSWRTNNELDAEALKVMLIGFFFVQASEVDDFFCRIFQL